MSKLCLLCTNLEVVNLLARKSVPNSQSRWKIGDPLAFWVTIKMERKMIKKKEKEKKKPMFYNTSMNYRLSSPSQATASIKS